MLTKEQKLEVFHSEFMKDQSKISQAMYYHDLALRKHKKQFQIPYYVKDFHEAIHLSQYYIEQYPEEYKFAELANRAIRKKTNTLREIFSKVIDDYSTLYFVTFTFSDKALSKTQESTRRKKLKEVLESLDCPYAFCLGFSSRHKREHYHALIAANEIELNWPYGLVDIKAVIDCNTSFNPISFDEDNYDEFSCYDEEEILQTKDLQAQIRALTRYMCNQSYESSIIKEKQSRIAYYNKKTKRKNNNLKDKKTPITEPILKQSSN